MAAVQGKQIEGTFWREMAIQMDSTLVEGKVYYFSNGAVSPANRKYSSVDNDYKINFNETKSSVREAEAQARFAMLRLRGGVRRVLHALAFALATCRAAHAANIWAKSSMLLPDCNITSLERVQSHQLQAHVQSVLATRRAACRTRPAGARGATSRRSTASPHSRAARCPSTSAASSPPSGRSAASSASRTAPSSCAGAPRLVVHSLACPQFHLQTVQLL
jgi:hypothetical protein